MKEESIGKTKKTGLFRAQSRGFSTLELLIAFSVLILSITAVIMVVFSNQSISIDTQTNNEALYKAQGLIEKARADSRQDFYSIVSQSSVDPSGPISYTKQLDVANSPDGFTKQVKSTVTWPQGGRTLNVVFATILTDSTGAAGGDTCNPTLSGDWTHPRLLGSADVGQNNGGTDVDVLGKKAYVTTDPSAPNKPNFYIVDVTDPTLSDLPILGSIDTNSGSNAGLAAVHVTGKYAYVANISTVTQLQVIDISVPSMPVVVASLKVTPVGDTAVGNSIFYANKKIYLGLTKSDGPEFYIIDVSDPLNPSIMGSFETDTRVNAITVKNNIAYIATPWPDSPPAPRPPTQENLSVLDVTNPGSINRINTFTAPDPTTMSGESLYISKDGTTLYLGRGGLNGANNPQFFELDVTNPLSISQINSKYIPTSNDVAVRAIAVRENLAFMWTSDTNLGFQIWDLNNLGSPTPYTSLNTQQTATGGFDCDGNILYTAQRSQKALQIIGPGMSAPIVTLDIHNASHDIIPPAIATVGDTVHASVAVIGFGPPPTGNVDFTFYTTSNNCTTGGTAAGTGIFLVGGIAYPSSFEGPLNAGSYSFGAHYGGDANYSVGDSLCEPLAIARVTPTISTTIYDNVTGQPITSVPPNTSIPVYEKAVVSGSFGIPTGSVTFIFFKNKDDCSGAPTSVGNVALDPTGIAQSSPPTAPQNNKPSSFRASYSGDANYSTFTECKALPVN